MARYHVSKQDFERSWIGKNPDGTYAWVPHEKAHQFQNYKEARAALDSLPDETLMYGDSYKTKCIFFKSYDDDDHMKRDMEAAQTRRLLRQWGH